MSNLTPESVAFDIFKLSPKEKLHLAAGLLDAPTAAMRAMAESIVRRALQEIEAERRAKEAQQS